MRHLSATLLVYVMLAALSTGAALAQNPPADLGAPAAGVAPASPIQIALPFNKAIVRESVPVKLHDFPSGGYVAVSVDGKFITAQALPRTHSDPVYVWDTKAGYTSPDDPNTTQYYQDGPHAITLAVYDAQSKLVGSDSVSVQLANKITMPDSQGINLAYPWSLSLRLRYQRRTILTAISTDAAQGTLAQTVQESLLRFRRTVENASAGTFLIRDEALPIDKTAASQPFVSYVSTRGLVQTLQSAYAIRAKYRVMDSKGHLLSQVGAENGGEQLGFSIPILPSHRVSVGEHWDSPVQITLDWASPYPATVTATSTLEDFEWQDRYPTAKIRETYTGPANFLPRPGSPLPPISSQDIKFERIIFFAYNSGRIVRMQTTLTLTSTAPGLLALATSTSTGNSLYPGSQQSLPQQSPGNQPPPSSLFPGGLFPGMFPNRQQFPGQRSSGSVNAGQSSTAGTDPVPIRLKYTDTSVLLI